MCPCSIVGGLQSVHLGSLSLETMITCPSASSTEKSVPDLTNSKPWGGLNESAGPCQLEAWALSAYTTGTSCFSTTPRIIKAARKITPFRALLPATVGSFLSISHTPFVWFESRIVLTIYFCPIVTGGSLNSR